VPLDGLPHPTDIPVGIVESQGHLASVLSPYYPPRPGGLFDHIGDLFLSHFSSLFFPGNLSATAMQKNHITETIKTIKRSPPIDFMNAAKVMLLSLSS
jgi:hypothetical protein